MIDVAGRTGTPFRMVLEEGKCREFRRAVTPRGWAGPVQPEELSPVTFLASARFWMAPEQSAWRGIDRDFRRVLHGEQEFVLPSGPLPVGTVLTATERIDRCYEKHGSRGSMVFTETVTDFAGPDGALLASSRATSITMPAATEAPAAAAAAAGAGAARPATPTFIDEPWTLTDFVRYQGASGDFNPIHHDPAFAAAGGHAGPFAVGMLTSGLASTVLGGSVDLRRLRRWTTRWRAQGWPGDAMSYAVRQGADEHAWEVDVLRPDGTLHMQAWAELADR